MASIINSTTTAGVTVTGDNSGSLQLATNNGTTALTIDTSQNVGIGMTNQTKKLETTGTLATRGSSTNTTWTGAGELAIKNGSGNAYMSFHGDTGTRLSYMQTSSSATELNAETGYLAFSTNTERMRVTSSGRVFINTTAEAGSNDSQVTIKQNESSGFYRCLSLETVVSANRTVQSFINTNGVVGTINTNGSATAYNTSSDYRLKENIAPMTGALSKVAQLKPVTYKWKVDGSDGQGFIAHELQEVVAGCVSGEKDAVDKNGNPEYQGIDTSFLVATLTAAIQELNAKVDAQALEIQALKGTL